MIDVYDGSMLWGTDEWIKSNRPQLMHTVDAVQWSARMRQLESAGIRIGGGLLMPFPSAVDRNFRDANRAVAESTASNGPASVATPVYALTPGDPTNVNLLHGLAQTSPPAGIKLWPYMGGYHLDDLLGDTPLIDLLASRRMMVLMHVGNGRERVSRPAFPDVRASPELALECARALSGIPVVIGHVARLSPATLEQIARTPNVYLDISGLTSLGRWIEAGVDGLPVDSGRSLAELGPATILRRLVLEYGLSDRIVFGTTWPFCTWWGIDLADDVSMVQAASLGQAEQQAILCGTLKRLIDSVDLAWP